MGKGLIGLIMLLAALMLAAACGGSDAKAKAGELIPEGSEVVGRIKIADILKDDNFKSLFQALPAGFNDERTFEELLGEAEAETGVDLRELDNILFFAKLSGKDAFASIAQGKFERDKLGAAFQKEAGEAVASIEYKGITVLEDEDEDISIAFLDEDTVVVGNSDSVRSVIDVQAGDAPALSGTVMDTFEGLNDAMVRVSVTIPDDAFDNRDQLPLDMSLNFDLSIFQEISTVGITLDIESDDYVLEAGLDFATETSAKSARDVVEGALLIAKGLSSGDTTAALLDQVKVAVDGATLSISARASISQLEELAGNLGNLGSLGDFGFNPFKSGGIEERIAVPAPRAKDHLADQERLQQAIDSWVATVGIQGGPNLPILQCGEPVRCVDGEVDLSRRCIGTLSRDGELTLGNCNPYIDIGALADGGFLRGPGSIMTANTELNTTAGNEPSGTYGWYLNSGGAVESFPPSPIPIPVPAPLLPGVPEAVATIVPPPVPHEVPEIVVTIVPPPHEVPEIVVTPAP